MSKFLTVPNENWKRARSMRNEPTRAEKRLWQHLSANQTGCAFRRQHPIGSYIADFVCLEQKLIIELDGGGHCEPDQIEYDKTRDQFLADRGFRIRRYSNRDVLTNLDGVMKDIVETLKE